MWCRFYFRWSFNALGTQFRHQPQSYEVGGRKEKREKRKEKREKRKEKREKRKEKRVRSKEKGEN
jgi:hypothetical protein